MPGRVLLSIAILAQYTRRRPWCCLCVVTCRPDPSLCTAMESQATSVPIGGRGTSGRRAADMDVERDDGYPRCVYEFVYLSFHTNVRTGARVPPCTLRLYDNDQVAFIGYDGQSSGIHGSWEFQPHPEQPHLCSELDVYFHWNGDEAKGKMMEFQQCPGYTTLWQSRAVNLLTAVVLVETPCTA